MLIVIPSGTTPHPPNTDQQEVRDSITVQFNGIPKATGDPKGGLVAHIFSDGSIKTSAQMHAENEQRKKEDLHLTTEEGKFPNLNQTVARKQAEATKMARIRGARENKLWSTIQKQLEKNSAEQEYREFLSKQAQDRITAAGAAGKN